MNITILSALSLTSR